MFYAFFNESQEDNPPFKEKRCRAEVFCCLKSCSSEAKILFWVQSLQKRPIFHFHVCLYLEIVTIQSIESYKGFDRKIKVWTDLFPNFDLTIKTFMTSNYSYRHNFQMKTEMNVKICKVVCTLNFVRRTTF